MTDFHGDEAIYLFLKKKELKMADSKKLRFSTPPILNIFFQKIHRLVFGLVGLIDAKALMRLNLYGREAVRHKLKNR